MTKFLPHETEVTLLVSRWVITCGVLLTTVSPDPSCPALFSPQLYRNPYSVRAMPYPSPIATILVSPLIFLTRCGVKNWPKVPDPQRKRLFVSSEIEALKLPAAMYRIGMWEISSTSFIDSD